MPDRLPHSHPCAVGLQTGLALLHNDGDVLKCYKSIHDAIW